MDFSVNCMKKIWLDWQPNKTEQSDNEKSHRQKLMNPAILSLRWRKSVLIKLMTNNVRFDLIYLFKASVYIFTFKIP